MSHQKYKAAVGDTRPDSMTMSGKTATALAAAEHGASLEATRL